MIDFLCDALIGMSVVGVLGAVMARVALLLDSKYPDQTDAIANRVFQVEDK